jgi:hypothetical protein
MRLQKPGKQNSVSRPAGPVHIRCSFHHHEHEHDSCHMNHLRMSLLASCVIGTPLPLELLTYQVRKQMYSQDKGYSFRTRVASYINTTLRKASRHVVSPRAGYIIALTIFKPAVNHTPGSRGQVLLMAPAEHECSTGRSDVLLSPFCCVAEDSDLLGRHA